MKGRSARLVGYRAISDAAGKAAMFVVTVLAARMLTPGAFGIFSMATAFGWMLSVATDCGIQLHVARVVALSPERSMDVLGRWLRVRLWTSLAAMLLAAVAVIFVAPAERTAVWLLAANYIAAGLVEFVYYFFRGAGRTDLESSLTVAHRVVLLACAVIALRWFRSVTALAVSLVTPTLLALAASLFVAFRVARAPSGSREHGLGDVGLWRQFAHDVLPIGAGIVLSAVYFRIDLFLVGRWLGPVAAGEYNAVFRLVEALRLFPAAALAVALPAIFRAGDERPLRRTAIAVTTFGTALAIAGVAASSWLVPLLYGDAYAGAIGAFRVLLAAFPLLSLNYALTHQLIGWNGQRSYVAICALALAVNVTLNAVLIPAEGIEGAAWATLWTELLLTASCAWKLWDLSPARQAGASVAVAGA